MSLYAAAVAATGVVSIAIMPLGAFLYGRAGPHAQLWASTAVYLAGVALTALAPSMWLLVAGLALRGLAAGMLGGLGLGVLSGLYPNPAERERAFGLFATMWVLPSLIGPAVNGILLATIGWRWSMVWPAVLLILGRVLVSRSLSIVEWEPTDERVRTRGAGAFVAIAAGLILAQAGVAAGFAWSGTAAMIVLVLVITVPFRLALRRTVPGQFRAQAGAWVLALVCGSYFSVNAFVPLLAATFVDGSGVLGAVIVSIGPLFWAGFSASGLGARLSRYQSLLFAAIAFPSASAILAAWALTLPGSAALGITALVAAMLLIGLAMGAIYPRVMTATFEGFQETNGTTRVHGGVVLGAGEDVGTAIGVTALAGTGGVTIALGAPTSGMLAATFAVALVALWALERVSYIQVRQAWRTAAAR